MNNKLSPTSFLERIVSSLKPRDYVVKIPKQELLSILKRVLSSKSSIDPLMLFEQWEPILSEARLVGAYLVRYNFFNESLNIEMVLPPSIIKRTEEIYDKIVNESVLREILSLNFRQFETLVQNIFSRLPWIESFSVTKRTKDGGIDFVGAYMGPNSKVTIRMLGQAKHWKSRVGPEPIKAFIGSVSTSKRVRTIGIFVSTEGFTQDAIKAVKKSPFRVLTFDKDNLANLMIKHRIGVRKIKFEGLTIDEKFWEEIRE